MLEFLRQMLEKPTTALDNLRRMEKRCLLESAEDWVEARNLRNRLVHEYMCDAEEIAGALRRALELVPMLIETFNRLRGHAQDTLGPSGADWPLPLLA